MNLTVFESGGGIFAGCEYIKGYTFKTVRSGETFALFAKLYRMLTANPAGAGDHSARLTGLTDCFECLSPVEYKTA